MGGDAYGGETRGRSADREGADLERPVRLASAPRNVVPDPVSGTDPLEQRPDEMRGERSDEHGSGQYVGPGPSELLRARPLHRAIVSRHVARRIILTG